MSDKGGQAEKTTSDKTAKASNIDGRKMRPKMSKEEANERRHQRYTDPE
jgi:hypothetical protein